MLALLLLRVISPLLSAITMKKKGIKAKEMHGSGGGGYLKSIVYGGLDGIITTFATVTSVAGANLSPSIVLILGIAHLFADGISMGMGDALSEQAEIDFKNAERAREQWEMDNHLEGEVDEMVEIYTNKGVTEADARALMEIMSKYKNVFLDNMMAEELHMLPIDPDDNPLKSGLVTFGAFVLFGFIPLLSYILNLFPHFNMLSSTQFWVACCLTVFTLFVLGGLKGRLVDVKSVWWKSGLVMAINGSAAATIGFVIGFALKGIPGGSG